MDDGRIEVPQILAVLGSREESSSLERILGDEWHVHVECSFRDVEAALIAGPFGIVISAARFDDGHRWTDVLARIRRMPVPPVLIVADRFAAEALWAEVLNLGGYDLLVTPFEREEVVRVLANACDYWRRENERTAVLANPSKAVEAKFRRSSHAAGAGSL